MGESRYFMDYKMNELKDKVGACAACDYICQASKEQLDIFFAFTKEDLKPGMVVVQRNGTCFMLMLNSDEKMMLINSDGKYHSDIKKVYDDNFNYIGFGGIREEFTKPHDIIEIYGLLSKNDFSIALNVGKQGRELLWERKEHEEKIGEKVNKGEIIIRGNKFTDIDKAINYLKKMKTLKQFIKQFNKPKYNVGNKFFFEDLCGTKNTIGIIVSLDVNKKSDYPEYGIVIGEKNYHNAEVIPLNEQELESLGKKINY